jgi:hypothetical protein
MLIIRRIAALSVAVLLALAGPAAASAAAPGSSAAATADSAAAAAPGYTYWGYYVWNADKSQWDYMMVGANDTKTLPEDGQVYGFRWALVVKDPRLPRAEPSFDEICSEEPEPAAGQKRIAIVIDYGSETDAPEGSTPEQARGACAVVDESATVQQALETVAEIRTGNGGLICAIDNYPAEGCGDTFKNATEGPADQPVALALPSDEDDQADEGATVEAPDEAVSEEDEGAPWGVIIAAIVVVVLAVGALALRRKQS